MKFVANNPMKAPGAAGAIAESPSEPRHRGLDLPRLKWFAIIAPLGFLSLLELVRYLYLESVLWPGASHLLALTLMIPAIVLFSHVIFTIITRMEQEVLRHNRHLAAMNRILTAVSRSLELDEILQVALDEVLQVMQVEVGIIALLDAEKQEIRAVVNRGIPPALQEHVKRVKLADALLEREVVQSGRPAVIHNLVDDPRVMDVAKQAGFQSLVCMPLKSKGVVRGLLGMASCERRSFSSSDVDLLMATGSQIAMAIENARLFAEARTQSERLRILNEVGISLTAEHSLDVLLQKVVDLSRELVGARYGALALIHEDGRAERVLTSGLGPGDRARVGALPSDIGLLGALLPLRDPPMKTLLGIPVRAKNKVIGALYLADKVDSGEFTAGDQDALETLAAQSAVAIENARLYAQLENLTKLQERERIAMDLHDGVIQSLYAMGLSLEDCAEMVREEPEEVARKTLRVVDDLNAVIKDIRNYIFDLRPDHVRAQGIVRALEEVVRAFKVNSLLDGELVAEEVEGLAEAEVSQLVHIAQEALANVVKHARASKAQVSLQCQAGQVVLSIRDNGTGFDLRLAEAGGGQGLRNMAERARALGGKLSIQSGRDGTEVRAEIPQIRGTRER